MYAESMPENRERYIKLGTKLFTPNWWQTDDVFVFFFTWSVLIYYNKYLLLCNFKNEQIKDKFSSQFLVSIFVWDTVFSNLKSYKWNG